MTRHLTPGQRAQLKANLELRQQELARQLAVHQEGRSRVEHAQDLLARDFDDAPQRAADREVDLAVSDIDARALQAVNQALQRIDDAEFGVCVDCAAEIPFDRLKIAPQALRCVACESRLEQLPRNA